VRRARRRFIALALLIGALALLNGCAAMAVQPWDRDLLSKKEMRFNAAPMMNAVDDHIYFSKEGSLGGMDVSGGGCGCN